MPRARQDGCAAATLPGLAGSAAPELEEYGMQLHVNLIEQAPLALWLSRNAGLGVAAAALTMSGSEAGAATLGQFRFEDMRANGVEMRRDAEGIRVSMPRTAWQDPVRQPLADRDYMAVVPADFHNGVIEVDVKGSLAPGAPEFARAFVGIAFRIAAGKFEQFYIRPTNGIAEDQVRRNHSVQYVSYPDYRFDRLRREAPERFETAADIAPDRWVHMRIEVAGSEARLYLDRRTNPTMIVKDLKLGAAQRGAIGLWVETATIAHFRNLKVTPAGR